MPGFNINAGIGPRHSAETSRRCRFRVKVMSPLSADLLFYAYKFTPPIIETDQIVMHHGQEQIALPGKHRVTPGEMTFYRVHDVNGDQAARELFEWHRSIIDFQASELQADANTKSFVKKTIEVTILDGAGRDAYVYYMYGCWPIKRTPSAFDSSDGGIADVTVSFSADKVTEDSKKPGDETETKMCDDAQAGAQAVDGYKGQFLNSPFSKIQTGTTSPPSSQTPQTFEKSL